MKAFAIISITGGNPDIERMVTPVSGWALVFQINANWGVYLVSGTGAQLTALNATTPVTGICNVTEGATTRWVELDDVVAAGVRTKLNTRLTALGKATIPAGRTNRQILQAVHGYFNNNVGRAFDPFDTDVTE